MGCVFYFFLLVTFFSVSEVTLLLWVANQTGFLFTMGVCVFTGLLGGYMVKQQGLQTFQKIQGAINVGQIPADEAVEALMIFVVGILLCVPGFITDSLGFLMLIPLIRKLAARSVVEHIKSAIKAGHIKVQTPDYSNVDADNFIKTPTDRIENAEIIEEQIFQGDEDVQKK